jgi:hypothetical protein
VKWWDKILVGVGFCLATLAIAGAVEQYRLESFINHICENKIAQEVPSPNGRSKVVVFTHDCGAAGYPHTIAAILPRHHGISKHQPIDRRLAAAAWEGYCKITVRWRDDRTILVEEFGGGEEESSAPFHERLKVLTDGDSGIKNVSRVDASEFEQP